ncbi:MAG: DNA primase regulatory subunit PriL, partial [Methanimicrococcus sp.]|nr:DNA primase regulatory subunit PriL [Methanimicrococcus sp.]
FPPCINKALSNVREGINLAHSMRFAMVSFLSNIGMSADDIVNVFNVSPDFSEEKTRYQVEHIAGNQYKTPSCATMQTYGNCTGQNNMCSKIRHPLSYYSALKFIAAERKEEEEKFGKDEVKTDRQTQNP